VATTCRIEPVSIAIGAMMPGFGGMGGRMGHTELLYTVEFNRRDPDLDWL
jgi:hypothetical protein